MPSLQRMRRTTQAAVQARRRINVVAGRLGTSLKAGRLAAGWTQSELANRVGVSQTEISRLERGHGATASLETWALAGQAVGSDLAAFFEATSGASLPRDYQHLKRQQLVADVGRGGAWTPSPELALDPLWPRSRSVDVLLARSSVKEVAIVEVWDFFDDVGSAWRGLDAKVAVVRRQRPEWKVAGLMVVRGTKRNRDLVGEFGSLFRARFPESASWLRALTTDAAMPASPGFVWTDVAGTKLLVARL